MRVVTFTILTAGRIFLFCFTYIIHNTFLQSVHLKPVHLSHEIGRMRPDVIYETHTRDL